MKLMGIKEILLLICIAGGLIVLTYNIKYMCKKYMERQKRNDDK